MNLTEFVYVLDKDIKCEVCGESFGSINSELSHPHCIDCWMELPADEADRIWKINKKELGLELDL